MLFQGSPVVNSRLPDVLVISFQDFSPTVENPEPFKGFLAPTKAVPPQRRSVSRLLELL